MEITQRLKHLLISTFALGSFILAGCTGAAPQITPTPIVDVPSLVTLTASGSGSVASLLTSVETAFEAAAPDIDLNVLSGSGTGGGVRGALDGVLDVAAMSRSPKEEETTEGLQYVSFGGSAVVMITHPDVEVTDLTQDQIRSIFAGEVTNWSEVGGQDLELVLYVRDEDESATGLLRETVFGEASFPETVAAVLTSTGDMVTIIESTPASIGFATYTGVLAQNKEVKTLTLDGFSTDTLDYPIILPLGIGFVESNQEKVQPLIDWLSTEEGQTALRALGVISPVSG